MKKAFILILLAAIVLAGCQGGDKKPAEDSPTKSAPAEDFVEAENEDVEIENENEPEPDDAKEGDAKEGDAVDIYEEGFVFIYGGVNLYMGLSIEAAVEDLGDWIDYYESESCTSEGMMVTYIYPGFELYGYAKSEGDEYRIFSVMLTDDSVATAEGVYIGGSIGDMETAYGNGHDSLPGFYKYEKNGTSLSFDVDGEAISAITYLLLNI